MIARASLFLAGLVAAGCYQPSIEPCRYACNDGRCPAGLECNGGMCTAPGGTCSTTDGGDLLDAADAPPDSSCGWPAISNVDPCALRAHEATTDVVVPQNITLVIDTDMLTATLSMQQIDTLTVEPQSTAAAPGKMVAVLRLRQLEAAGEVVVRGARPLVVLVHDTATISGGVTVEPSALTDACSSAGVEGETPDTQSGGGGGGGGGFGGNHVGDATIPTGGYPGGTGGRSASNVSGGLGGDGGGIPLPPPDLRALSPLRGGCPGGRGGAAPPDAGSAPGGVPGLRGGALQLSARALLTVSGMIHAPGGGGGSGANASGGAGGGAGGAILLEAPMVRLEGARLCANGGSGGGSSLANGNGRVGNCSLDAAIGGGPTVGSIVNNGGDGATQELDATVGRPGMEATDEPPMPARGGGGGGGGVGRIRVNGVLTGEPALATPMFTRP